MFRLVLKNKKGVSLVELLVTLVIIGLLLPIAGQILYSLSNIFKQSVDRWDIQTAVRLACRQFETSRDGLTNAYETDIIYDPVIDEGVLIDDSYNITWVNGISGANGTTSTYVMDPEGTQHTGLYTYIFSAPTWKNDGGNKGEYLGELLYIRDYGSMKSRLILQDYGLETVPVSISFSMGTLENFEEMQNKYTSGNIRVEFSSGLEDAGGYSLKTTFALVNNLREINVIDSALVCEEGWVSGGNVKAFPVGWDSDEIGTDINKGFPKSTSVDGSNFYAAKYTDSSNTSHDVRIPVGNTVEKTGNLLRYKSPSAMKSQGTVQDKAYGGNIATCLSAAVMRGSSNEDKVLGNIRMFRDNVLAGTKFGDWFIHEYYYTWSPFLVKHMDVLKPVYKAIIVPVSYICGLISRI